MSEALTLRVYLNPQDSKRLSEHIWIISTLVPVHARYRLPSNNESLTHKSIVILHPSLFSTYASTGISQQLLSASCYTQPSALCDWKFIKTSHLTMNVPVGQLRNKSFVLAVTVIVTIVIVFKLLGNLLHPCFSNHKKHD